MSQKLYDHSVFSKIINTEDEIKNIIMKIRADVINLCFIVSSHYATLTGDVGDDVFNANLIEIIKLINIDLIFSHLSAYKKISSTNPEAFKKISVTLMEWFRKSTDNTIKQLEEIISIELN